MGIWVTMAINFTDFGVISVAQRYKPRRTRTDGGAMPDAVYHGQIAIVRIAGYRLAQMPSTNKRR